MDHETLPAIVMAAGHGRRLAPLTDQLPKPLLPIHGIAAIDHAIDQLTAARCQPEQIMVVTGHEGDKLDAHIRARGYDVKLCRQEPLTGPAGSVMAALTAGHPRTRSVISVADTMWPNKDVSRVIRMAQELGPDANVISLSEYEAQDAPYGFQTILDEEGRILQLLAPTADHGRVLAPAGLHVLGPAFFDELERGQGQDSLFAHAIQALIDQGCPVHAARIAHGDQITRPMDVLRLNFDYLAPYV